MFEHSQKIERPVFDLEDRIREQFEGYDVDVPKKYDSDDESGYRETKTNEYGEWYVAEAVVELDDMVIEVEQSEYMNSFKFKYNIVEADNLEAAREIGDQLETVWDGLEYDSANDSADIGTVVNADNYSREDIVLDEETWQDVEETVFYPIEQPEVYEALDIDVEPGLILEGPPGTGKTLLGKVIAGEIDANVYNIKSKDVMNKYVGDSPKAVHDMYETARKEDGYTILFFDEIDVLTQSRGDDVHEVTRQVVSAFLAELDGMEGLEDVLTIGTTNRYEVIDPALTRSGRLGGRITVEKPSEEARGDILELHIGDAPVAENVDYEDIADVLEDSTGADIRDIVNTAKRYAARDAISAEDAELGREHFEQALDEISDGDTDYPNHIAFQ